jgi:hypothetical protein
MGLLNEFDAFFKSLTEADRQTAQENRFPYIYSKAALFLKMKPEIYRKNDFFGQPPAEFDEEDIAILKHGCQQVLEGKGFKKENPFTGLDVFGFSALMRLFHFQQLSRKTFHTYEHEERTGILDCITFRHLVEDTEVVYYNFCELRFD